MACCQSFRHGLLIENSYDEYSFMLKRNRCGVHPTENLQKMLEEFLIFTGSLKIIQSGFSKTPECLWKLLASG
jgi:hypothetical protein